MRRWIARAVCAGFGLGLPALAWVAVDGPAAADPLCADVWVRADGSTTWVPGPTGPGTCVSTPFTWLMHDETGNTFTINVVPQCETGCGAGWVIDLVDPTE